MTTSASRPPAPVHRGGGARPRPRLVGTAVHDGSSGSCSSTATADRPRSSSRSPTCHGAPTTAVSRASRGCCGSARRAGHRPRTRRGDLHARAQRDDDRPRRRPRVGAALADVCRTAGVALRATSPQHARRRAMARLSSGRGRRAAVGARLGAARLRRAGPAGRPADPTSLGRRAHRARLRGVPRRRRATRRCEVRITVTLRQRPRRGDRRRARRPRRTPNAPSGRPRPAPAPSRCGCAKRGSPVPTSPSCCACRRSGCRS